MSNTDDLRFECVHCGKCCTDLNTLVNTTYSDILRVKDGLNLSQDEVIEILGFYIFDEKPKTEEMDRMVIPPIETERGLAFTGLKKKPNGECYFFNNKAKRCSIYKFRPNFCRTFPFTFTLQVFKENSKKQSIKVFYTEKGLQYCQGITEEKTRIDMDYWIQLGQKVINDLSNNTVLIKKWNESVKNGLILPTVRNFIITIFNLER